MVKILFHHIPKTGGTTINNYFASLFPKEEVWTSDFIKRERQFLKETLGKSNLAYDDHRWEFYFNQLSFIGAHFNMIERSPADVFKFTILREPISRTISQYKDWQRLTSYDIERDPPLVKEAKTLSKELSIKEFLNVNNRYMQRNFHNLQCKSLIPPCLISEGKTNLLSEEELLSYATEAIEKLDFVGLTEKLFDSLNMVLFMIGLEKLESIGHQNSTQNKTEISEEDLEVIRHVNKADTTLYNKFREKFEREYSVP
jgi:hypothetical protein